MKTIGIIGGMGPLATADLFKKIVLKTKAETDQEHIHVLIDSNTRIPDRTKSILSREECPLEEIIKTAKQMENSGADFLVMSCNTAHYYYEDICRAINIPLLNMLAETAQFIERTYGRDITAGLLATDGTIRTGIYDEYFSKSNIKVIKPVQTQKYVMEFIYEGIKKGDYSFSADRFYEAMEELKRDGAEIFVLGCTELSSAREMFHFEGNFIDPVDVIAERAIEFAGGEVKK
jgi:aspartate racemase